VVECTAAGSRRWTTIRRRATKAGGITTVFEKSLGGVTKGGTTPMMDVFLYGEPITTRGFVFMERPATIPCRSPGWSRAAATSSASRPAAARCSVQARAVDQAGDQSLMYRHMAEDMDINCGVVLEGTPIATVGRQIFEEVIAVASGKRSKSELSGGRRGRVSRPGSSAR